MKNEQKLIDVLFEIAMRTKAGEYDHLDQEEFGAYISDQLNQLGFLGGPKGMCWHSLYSTRMTKEIKDVRFKIIEANRD